jgi:hypothetical protein
MSNSSRRPFIQLSDGLIIAGVPLIAYVVKFAYDYFYGEYFKYQPSGPRSTLNCLFQYYLLPA